MLGVGHRVVHGGARLRRPMIVTPAGPGGAARAGSAGAAAPAVQPGGDRSGRSSDCPACPRSHASTPSFHRGHAAVAELVPLPRELRRRRRAALRLPRTLLRVHRLGAARGRAGDCRRARDRRAPRQRREPLRARKRQERRQHPGLHGARRPVHGHAPGRARSRRRPLPLPEPRPLGEGGRDDPLQEVGAARHFGHQQRHARPARAAASPSARLAVDYFVYRAAKEIGALAAVLGGIDGLVFTAGIGENSAEIRERICEASRLARRRARRRGERRGRGRGSRTPGSQVSAWVIPTNEELMIARHTGALLGLVEARV